MIKDLQALVTLLYKESIVTGLQALVALLYKESRVTGHHVISHVFGILYESTTVN